LLGIAYVIVTLSHPSAAAPAVGEALVGLCMLNIHHRNHPTAANSYSTHTM